MRVGFRLQLAAAVAHQDRAAALPGRLDAHVVVHPAVGEHDFGGEWRPIAGTRIGSESTRGELDPRR